VSGVAGDRVSRDEFETERIGRAIGRVLRGGDVLVLEGPLGAGKTRLVRGIAAGLGIDPSEVSSPTFVLVQEYGPSGGGLTLAHADAYRLDGPESLDSVGWDEFAGHGDVVTILEWGSRIAAALPLTTVWIEIEPSGHDPRSDAPTRERIIRVRTAAGEASAEAVARVRAAIDAAEA
jgi:tRNA threonylcarbamoyladenosine biosynthesis protein TsaE